MITNDHTVTQFVKPNIFETKKKEVMQSAICIIHTNAFAKGITNYIVVVVIVAVFVFVVTVNRKLRKRHCSKIFTAETVTVNKTKVEYLL